MVLACDPRRVDRTRDRYARLMRSSGRAERLLVGLTTAHHYLGDSLRFLWLKKLSIFPKLGKIQFFWLVMAVTKVMPIENFRA
ncbi:hypothetical protein LC605_27225 [Nostoc sp. CHAB 5836]|nr:hypothetical protein [Nostoc sp. CHAB 5836]